MLGAEQALADGQRPRVVLLGLRIVLVLARQDAQVLIVRADEKTVLALQLLGERKRALIELLRPDIVLPLTVDLTEVIQERAIVDAMRVFDLLHQCHGAAADLFRLVQIARVVSKNPERRQALHVPEMVRPECLLQHVEGLPEQGFSFRTLTRTFVQRSHA
jgi:hypothetical protein